MYVTFNTHAVTFEEDEAIAINIRDKNKQIKAGHLTNTITEQKTEIIKY